MSIEIRSKRVSRWLALGALTLAFAGSALGQQASQDKVKESIQQKIVAPSDNQDAVLVALVEPAPAPATTVAPVPSAPPPASSYSWTGFYVGGNVGFGMGNGDTSFSPLPTAAQFVNLAPQTLHPNPNGVQAGAQFGFNWQVHRFVLGAETDLSYADIDGTVRFTPIIQNNGTPFPGAGFVQARQDITWFGTARGRLGFAPISRLLLYGTGGLAYGHVIYLAETNFRPVGTTDYLSSFNKNKTGFAAGAGVEVIAGRRWSVKAEYLHLDMGSEATVVNANPLLPPFQVGYHFDTTAQIVRGGINFRF